MSIPDTRWITHPDSSDDAGLGASRLSSSFLVVWLLSSMFLLPPLFAGKGFTEILVDGIPLSATALDYDSPAPSKDGVDEFEINFGWPRQLNGDVPLINRTITVIDIDANSDWELSALTSEGRLHVYQHDGAHFPSFPLETYYGNRRRAWERSGHPATSAAGDIDGDDQPDLIYTTDIGYLHVMSEEGEEPFGFPVDFGRNMYAGMPAVVDLDGNGECEIIFQSWDANPDSEDVEAFLNIIGSDGEPFHNWYLRYPNGSTSSPAVGDIDNDGQYEIAIGNARSLDEPAQIMMWHQNGLEAEGFPVGEFETIGGSPVLADITGDGDLEVLIWAALIGGREPGVYAWDAAGELIERFPLRTDTGHPNAGPIVADIGGSHLPEIIFGTFDPENGSQIYAWETNGQLVNAFPIDVDAPSIVGSVIAADVSGDGVNDIIAALAPNEEHNGLIAAWDDQGEMVEGFPLSLDELGGGSFAGTPTVHDIDRDGDLDLAVVTTNRHLIIWDTPGRVSWDQWPTLRGGMSRNGIRPMDDPRSVDGGLDPLPVFIALDAYPNPFNNRIRFNFSLDPVEATNVKLFEIGGRSLGTLYYAPPGSAMVKLTMDSRSRRLTAGTYVIRIQQGGSQFSQLIYFLP